MAYFVWDGSSSTDGTVAANWSGGSAPPNDGTAVLRFNDSSDSGNSFDLNSINGYSIAGIEILSTFTKYLTNASTTSITLTGVEGSGPTNVPGIFAALGGTMNIDASLTFVFSDATLASNDVSDIYYGVQFDSGQHSGSGDSSIDSFFGMFYDQDSIDFTTFEFQISNKTLGLINGVYPNIKMNGTNSVLAPNNFNTITIGGEGVGHFSNFDRVKMADLTLTGTDDKLHPVIVSSNYRKNAIDYDKVFEITGAISIASDTFDWGYSTLEITPKDADVTIPTSSETSYGPSTSYFNPRYHRLVINDHDYLCFLAKDSVLTCHDLDVRGKLYAKDTSQTDETTASEIHVSGSVSMTGDWNFQQISDGIYRSFGTKQKVNVAHGGTGQRFFEDGTIIFGKGREGLQTISTLNYNTSTNTLNSPNAHFTGKLTVDGLIDPTGVVFTPQATNPESTNPQDTIWIDSETNHLFRGNRDTESTVHFNVRNDEGATIPVGAPLYSKGEIGGSNRIKVGIADASDANKMPAIGLAMEEMNTTSTKDGNMILTGILNENITITSVAEQDIIYVAPHGGSAPYLTITRPTSASHLVQNVGVCVRQSSANVSQGMKVAAIGRTNDVPNTISIEGDITSNGNISALDGNIIGNTFIAGYAAGDAIFRTYNTGDHLELQTYDAGTSAFVTELEILNDQGGIQITNDVTSSGDLTLDRGSATSSLTRALTIGGARNATDGVFAEIAFKNYDSNSGAADYTAGKIRMFNNPDGDDDGTMAFYTANNETLNTSPALSITDTGYVRVGPSGSFDAPLTISQNTTTTGPSGNAQLVVKGSGTSGQDASIEVRGARNSSTTAVPTSIKFTNYDNDLSGSNILGAVIGKVTNHTTNVGSLILQTSADGSALSDRLTITSAGNVTIANDLTVQGDFTVSGTTTTVDTTNLNITDNIITLNDGETGAGVTLGTAGIDIDRGTATNATFLYDDSIDGWVADSQGTARTLKLQNTHGYIEFGPQNTSYAHITTDRSRFYFNRDLVIGENAISSYNGDFSIRRSQSTDEQIVIGDDSMTFTSAGNDVLFIDGTNSRLAIGTSSHNAGKLTIDHNVTNPETDAPGSFAIYIDADLSGSTTATSDREQGGIYVDLKTTATGGNATDEHRPYGVWADVRVNTESDADAVYGIYGYVEAQRSGATGATTGLLRGGYFFAASDEDSQHTVSELTGALGYASIQDAGTVSTSEGLRGFTNVHSNRSTNVGNLRGVSAEVDISSGRTAGNDITTGYSAVFHALLDHNPASSGEGTVTVANSYLYYGSSSITDSSQVTNDWGLYLTGEDKNYFSGKVGIGYSNPANLLHIHGDMADGKQGILITRNDSSTVEDNLLGGIGFDSSDGNMPSSITEASVAIVGYASEGHGTGDKGGYLSILLTETNDDDDTTSPEVMRVSTVSAGTSTTLRLRNNNTSMPNDTKYGSIEFYNADASGAGVGATIDALSNGSGRGGYLQFRTDPDGSGNPFVRMTIDESGNVGINQTSPAYTLDVDGNLFLGKSGETTALSGSPQIFVQGDTAVATFKADNASSGDQIAGIRVFGDGYRSIGMVIGDYNNTTGATTEDWIFGRQYASTNKAGIFAAPENGGDEYITVNSDGQKAVKIAGDNDDIDFIIHGSSGEYFRAEASTGRIGIGVSSPSTELEIASTGTFKLGNAELVANQFRINNTGGYAQIELGGSSGAYIDMKTPFSDDFDARIITAGSDMQLITASASTPILLKTNGTTRMSVKDDRIELAKDLHFATGTTPKINGGNQNPLIIYGNTDGNPTSTSGDYVTWSTSSAVEIRANSSEQTVMRAKDNKEVDFFGLVNGPGRNEGAYGANSFHFGDTGSTEADDWYEVFRWSPNAIMTSASSPQYRNFAARFKCTGRGNARVNFDIYVRGEYGVQDSNGWWAREFIIDGLDETTDDDGNASPDADSLFLMVYNAGTSLSYPYASLYMRRDENWEIRTCNLVSMYTNCVFEFLDNNVGETTPTNDGNTGSYDQSPSIRRKLFVDNNNQLINGVGATAIYFDDTNDRVGIGNSSPATLLDIKGAAANSGGTYRNHLSIIDTAAYNTANAGGSIILGGVDDSSGGTSWWAKIAGEKANTTDGNQSGILNFYTRKDSSAPVSRMVIDEDGNVTVGTTGAAGKLYLSADDAGSFIGWNVSGSDITLAAGDDLILHADDDIFFQSGGSTQMTFLNTGELGIGTTTPEYKLDVQSGTIRILPTISSNAGTAIRIGAGGNSNDITLLRIDGGDPDNQGESDSAQYGFSMKYMGSGTVLNNRYAMFMDNEQGTPIEAMSILQNGKVGIGNSVPDYALDVVANSDAGIKLSRSGGASVELLLEAASGDNRITFSDGGTDKWCIGKDNTDNSFRISDGGALGANDRITIDSTGNVGIGTSSPDVNLHVSHATDPKIRVQDITANFSATLAGYSGGAYLAMGDMDSNESSWMLFGAFNSINNLNTKTRDFHLYGTNTTTGFYFDESVGNFGIGTTSPSTPLHIRSTTTTLDNLLTLENNGASGTPGVGIKMFSNVGTTNYLEILHDAFGATNFKTTNGASSYNKQMHLQSDGDVSFEAGDVGVGTASPNQKLTVEGSMSLKEQTSSNSDTASYGQLWVKNASPNQLWFTNDTGIDIQITDGTGVYAPSATVDFKPAVFMDSGNVNITLTETTIPFDTEVLDPSSNAALVTGLGNDGKIRLTAGGYYQISYSIPINDDGSTGADRTRVYVVMQVDDNSLFSSPTTVAQSRAQVYTREASGGSGLSTTFIYNHTANDYIRLRIDAQQNTDISTETNQSQISIQYLGT